MTVDTIAFSDFEKVDIRAGTIVSARLNEKAKKAAYVLEIDFGPEIGVKKSSAQIVDAYTTDRLLGLQIVAVINFAPKNIANIKSEVLVLGVVQEGLPTILLTPSEPVANGCRVM